MTEVIPFTQYPALAKGANMLMDALSENLAGEALRVSDLPSIKVPAGGGLAWEVPTPTGPQPMRQIEALVLYTKRERNWWETSEPTKGTPPSCSSDDCIIGLGDNGEGFGKHECDTCPQNQWGSGRDGRGLACRECRLWYLMLPNSILPTLLRVPATSLGAAREYLVQLSTAGLPYHQVITRFGLEKATNAGGQVYTRVNFQRGPTLPEEEHVRLMEMIAAFKPQLRRMRSRDVIEGDVEGDDVA